MGRAVSNGPPVKPKPDLSLAAPVPSRTCPTYSKSSLEKQLSSTNSLPFFASPYRHVKKSLSWPPVPRTQIDRIPNRNFLRFRSTVEAWVIVNEEKSRLKEWLVVQQTHQDILAYLQPFMPEEYPVK